MVNKALLLGPIKSAAGSLPALSATPACRRRRSLVYEYSNQPSINPATFKLCGA